MVSEEAVRIPAGPASVDADLTVPEEGHGIVLFAHGSGSSRFSPRNRFVAQVLNDAGLATLLIDLLTGEEEETDLLTRRLRFDIQLLTQRTLWATKWLGERPDLLSLRLGYFGASTGAAAALVAASRVPDKVRAVVSRGGRPDLAGPALSGVLAPTLLIVGGYDHVVLDLNREAMAALGSREKELLVIPGATHLFEEEGALEAVARAASDWFQQWLSPQDRPV